MANVNIKEGEILESTWGYGQTNVDFYMVKSVKGQWATVQEIGQEIASDEGWMAETVVPNREPKGAPFRRKIREGTRGEYQWVGINSYAVALPWSGSPQFQSHWN